MFFVLDENHNLVEAYSKEDVLALLEKAISDGSLAGITEDSAFVSKLKCCVTGGTNKVAFVTQAQYNTLKANGNLVTNCLYIVTDDKTASNIDAELSELTNKVNGIIDGSYVVPKATDSEYAVLLKPTSAYSGSDTTSCQITQSGVYIVRLLNWSSDAVKADFYTDIISINVDAVSYANEYGLLRTPSGEHVLKYNYGSKTLIVNAIFSVGITKITSIRRIA